MERIIRHFIVAVCHDRGKASICTAATNAEKARQLVSNAEACPEQAVISVVEVIKNKRSKNIKI